MYTLGFSWTHESKLSMLDNKDTFNYFQANHSLNVNCIGDKSLF